MSKEGTITYSTPPTLSRSSTNATEPSLILLLEFFSCKQVSMSLSFLRLLLVEVLLMLLDQSILVSSSLVCQRIIVWGMLLICHISWTLYIS